MSAEHDAYYNLAERIDDAYPEIDSDITTDLQENDAEYAGLRREARQMQQDNPVIVKLLDGSGAMSLTADEHEVILKYLDLQRRIEDVERKQVYFRGHTDSIAYLKRIGAI
jgi:hypothetical protein